MSQVKIKILDREDFNKAVIEAEKIIPKLGIVKPNACVEYSYIDKDSNIIKLICREG